MNQQNNIDDLFKNSAQQFSAPAPKMAWANIDGILKRKRKVILIQRVLLAATIVIIASVAFFVNLDYATPIIVDNDLETIIETPKTNTSKNAEINNTDIVNNESIIEKKNLESKFINKSDNNESNEIIDNKIADATKQIINEVEENIIIVNNISENKTLDLNIEKEVVKKDVIVINNDLNIYKEESQNKFVTEETLKEIKPIKASEVSLEIALAEKSNTINKEPIVKEIDKEVDLDAAAVSIVVNKSTSVVIKSNTIKQEATEVVKSVNSNQINEVVENNAEELAIKTSEVESANVVEQNTNSTIAEMPNEEDAKIARAEALEIQNGNTKARSSVAELAKNWDVDFFIGQTYGGSITNGIGKTPEIDNPTLSEAGATKASSWFSAAVNFELDVNNWVIKSGVRRYNLEIQGDFEVKQKNPWNVDLDQYAFSELGYIKVLNINANLRLSQPSSIIFIQDFNHYNIKVRYIDIPLSIGYKFKYNNLSIMPHVGVNYTIAHSNEVELSSEDDYYMFGEVTDLKQLMVGITAGAGAYYTISKHWVVGLDTEMVYYPTTVSTNSTFSYKPYSLLVGPSIAFKF